MVKKNETQEEEINWVIDVKKTLFYNMIWIPMFIVTWIFAFIGISKVNLFLDQGFQIMYLIVIIFAVIRLVAMVGNPRIELMIKRE